MYTHKKKSITDEINHGEIPDSNLRGKESDHVNNLKQTIQWLLDDRRINEAELSRATNLSAATIHRLIYGITDPRLSTLEAIASFFKIRIEQLIGDYPIPSITQINNKSADKIFFSTPILIPFVEWNLISDHINDIHELTMNNWQHWHSTTSEIQEDEDTSFFATKLDYTAGNLLHAESIIVIKPKNDIETIKIGECVIGSNDKGTMFVGQVSGSKDTIIIKGNSSFEINKCEIYGLVIKCETPFSKISRYTAIV